MRKVQSYIANVSFPTSLEEMEELVNGEYYMDMEALLLFDDARFTAPKWAAKGDIVFFYHAKSAITKIRHLKSLLKNEKEKYRQTYDEIEKYLETAEAIYKKYGGTIFAVGTVCEDLEIVKDDPREHLHWKSNIYAPINNITNLDFPVDKAKFEEYVKLSMQRTITPVPGSAFDGIKRLVLRYNDVPFIEKCEASPMPLKDINDKNWMEIAKEYKRRFFLEIQFRKFYVDYLLKSVSDKKKTYSECSCWKNDVHTGFADNFITMNKKYLAVEVKLNIDTERDIQNQLEKYSFCNMVKLDKKTTIYKKDIHQSYVLVIDMNRVCIYNSTSKTMLKLIDLDSIECMYDVRKLRNEIIKIMESK